MQTVTYKNYSVIVREATVGDGLAALRLSRIASTGAGETDLGYWVRFGEVCSQGQDGSPTLGFDLNTLATADDKTIHSAYEAFLKLPDKFVTRWEKAIAVENSEDDPATGPNPLGDDAPLAGENAAKR